MANRTHTAIMLEFRTRMWVSPANNVENYSEISQPKPAAEYQSINILQFAKVQTFDKSFIY